MRGQQDEQNRIARRSDAHFFDCQCLMLRFVLNSSQQNTTGQQLASTEPGTADSTAAGDATGAVTSSGGSADPVALKTAMDIGKTEYVSVRLAMVPMAKV